MVLEVCSSGAFDVLNVQVTDVLRYTMRMVTHRSPRSETIQRLLEKERCVRGEEEFQSAWC